MTSTHELKYRIVNNKRTDETNDRTVVVHASEAEIADFVRDGYLVRSGWFDEATRAGLVEAVDEVVAVERDSPDAEYRPGNGLFLRSLQARHPAFRALRERADLVSIARAVLGPQVRFEADARVAFEDDADRFVGWHIHRRVVPTPTPPFFCHPHGVHCLIYLNDVSEAEGGLVVLPGSHRDGSFDRPFNDTSDLPDQQVIYPRAGDAVFIHSNLWHRTEPTSDGCERRRLLILGFDPSWLNTDGSPGEPTASAGADDPGAAELAGRFDW